LIDFIQFNHKHYFLTSHNRHLYIYIYIFHDCVAPLCK